ncbi:UDP-glucose 4-epimerase GalE [Leptospira langatensis]|uniref:UDP-glucose 4-epimerase n=1 Tax=Leptospira langatensis TaxID=2484983 RepID=A0A5F1ZZJ8_9LEPT|nr:UDP-glucose 4-epimerase GalE [Leptospira langatensis]TGK04190.1 UDP-glucose 4-epimerase GalE [Leptospira langatensis]TGL43670.1 UDP-glucose 4-epimerase GalE [Leptospira langatensis]
MKKILITGGAGYIGSHMNKYLHKEGVDTVVFDNLSNGHKKAVKWGTFVQGDLLNKEDLEKVFQENEIEAVIHFAAFAYVGESVLDPQKYYINNLVGTINLLEAMLRHKVRNFIFSSTCATYGAVTQVPIVETNPQSPINPYGWSKLMIERVLEDYSKAYGLKYVALRYFNASGSDLDIGEEHDPETHLLPIVIENALGKRDQLVVNGDDYNTKDGTAVRDYIHVMDLAQAHYLGLKYLQNGGNSDVFNLGIGTGFSVLEIIQTVEKISGKKLQYKIGPRREGDPAILIADNAKAKKILGWDPKFANIETIVSSAWEFHKSQG